MSIKVARGYHDSRRNDEVIYDFDVNKETIVDIALKKYI